MNNDILQLKESIEAVLADVCTSAALHKFDDGAEPLDEKLWTQAGALGWLAIPLPEAAGGLGLGIEAEAALHQALGQYLAPGPYIATLAAARALAALHREDLLHGMAEGAFSLAIAAEPPQTALRLTDGRVSGATGLLLGQATARFAAVPALAENGSIAWVLLQGDGLTAWAAIDHTRSLCAGECASKQPLAVFAGEQATRFGQALIQAALLGVAADCIGAATSNFAQVVAYLGTRQQFGKPIGAFQALKHRCANHTIALETCRELVAHAVARAEHADGLFWARLAKAEAAAMAVRMAEDGIQLHGGVGFTWEFDCHFYLKRAKLNQALFGREAAQFDEAAVLAIAGGGSVLLGDAA